jgi:hypothetical protein
MVLSFLLFYLQINFNILDIQLLSDAFHKLQQNFQVNLVQSKGTIGQDIYVLLAESALDVRFIVFFLLMINYSFDVFS